MSVLINKQHKSYGYLSRYSSFPFYYNTNDSKYVYGITAQLKQNIPYVLHKIKPHETLDSIALDMYNNPTFFWVIADFNHIQDPYIKLKIGDTLKIPSLSDISFEE